MKDVFSHSSFICKCRNIRCARTERKSNDRKYCMYVMKIEKYSTLPVCELARFAVNIHMNRYNMERHNSF